MLYRITGTKKLSYSGAST